MVPIRILVQGRLCDIPKTQIIYNSFLLAGFLPLIVNGCLPLPEIYVALERITKADSPFCQEDTKAFNPRFE